MVQPSAAKPVPLPMPDEECDASSILIEESRKPSMRDLKDELASLKINREQPKRRSWGLWIVLLLLVAAASAAGMYLVKTRPELTNVAAVEVEPVRVGVDLDERAGLRRRLQHGFEVHGVTIALQQQPAGGVAQHRHERMADGSNDAIGHLLAAQAEVAMDARHHVIQLPQQLVIEIEAAVGKNIAFGPFEDPQSFQMFLQLVNFSDLRS